MKKIVRLTESDLVRLVRKILTEQNSSSADFIKSALYLFTETRNSFRDNNRIITNDKFFKILLEKSNPEQKKYFENLIEIASNVSGADDQIYTVENILRNRDNAGSEDSKSLPTPAAIEKAANWVRWRFGISGFEDGNKFNSAEVFASPDGEYAGNILTSYFYNNSDEIGTGEKKTNESYRRRYYR